VVSAGELEVVIGQGANTRLVAWAAAHVLIEIGRCPFPQRLKDATSRHSAPAFEPE
jgi:hypothetical protein